MTGPKRRTILARSRITRRSFPSATPWAARRPIDLGSAFLGRRAKANHKAARGRPRAAGRSRPYGWPHKAAGCRLCAKRKRPALGGPAFAIGCLPALRGAAAPSAAAAALLRLVYPQGTSTEVLAIQVLNGPGSIGSRHFNESKAAGPAGV